MTERVRLAIEARDLRRGYEPGHLVIGSYDLVLTLRSAHRVWMVTSDIWEADREHFLVFDLDSRHRVIERRTVAIGSLNNVETHPREVFKGALLNSAAAVICVHNHPSGDHEPSREDVEVTHRLRQGADILGVTLLDHVVVSKNGYASLADRGWAYVPPAPGE